MEKYEVYENEPVMFHNRAFSCIGTGRMDLALHKEYLDQLALVQKKIGFDYIRGHGLFCKDMAIYQEFITPDGSVKEEYNFTYLDMVMDAYQDFENPSIYRAWFYAGTNGKRRRRNGILLEG